VVVAVEATRNGRPTDVVGWLLWSALWVTIAAFVAVFVLVPILAAEFLVWGYVARRYPAVDATTPAVILSCAVIALPWGVGPWASGWGAAPLVFVGLAVARVVVPSLGPGAFSGRGEAGA
jgi:hypothetical protein